MLTVFKLLTGALFSSETGEYTAEKMHLGAYLSSSSLSEYSRLIPMLEEAFGVHPAPTYATIMRIDSKIRKLPHFDPEKEGLDLMTMNGSELMQLFCVGGLRELSYLYLHRRFLFDACNDASCEDLSKHKYIYSITACFRSSVTMIRQLRGLYWRDKELSFRVFFLWLHGYSGIYLFHFDFTTF